MTTTFITALHRLRSRMTAVLAIGAIGLTAGLVATAPAQALPKGGGGGSNGSGTAYCPIEIDGHISYVPEGTHVGILYCGHDGNWHIGWLVDGLARGGSSGQGTQPVISVPNASSLLLPAV